MNHPQAPDDDFYPSAILGVKARFWVEAAHILNVAGQLIVTVVVVLDADQAVSAFELPGLCLECPDELFQSEGHITFRRR